MKKWILPTIAASGVLFAFMVMSGGAAGENAAQEKKKPFEDRFWEYLKKVDYTKKYSPWPGTEDEFLPGNSPHGAQLKLYVNEQVTKNPDDPPHKSIIIKENYSPEKKLGAVTIMYRVENYDADNKDWYWVKYLPDGTVDKKGDMKLAGKVKGCIDCHNAADGGDYVFMND